MRAPGVSVVIPAIDEAEQLPGLLADLAGQRDIELEVIVADGGSRDATRAVARAAGARWIACDPGRGRQMNAGAAAARHDWLWFVHADCRLTEPRQLRAACDRLTCASGHDRPVAGHFALRFDHTGGDDRFLFRYMAAKTATGRRYTINGDQGLLLARGGFEALGGFDMSLPFLEDQRMADAIRARGGHFCLLPGQLVTSARRFQAEGPRRRYLLMALMMAMHLADVPCFFERAPQVYARQGRTGRLALGPYVALIGGMAWRCGCRATMRGVWRVAGLIIGQCWQLCFAVDVWRAGRRCVDDRLTRGYNKHVARFVEQPLAKTLVVAVLLAFFIGPAMAYAVCWARFCARRESL